MGLPYGVSQPHDILINLHANGVNGLSIALQFHIKFLFCSIFKYCTPMVDVYPTPFKRAGAVSNATGRFEEKTVYAVNDGWDLRMICLPSHFGNRRTPKTIITEQIARRSLRSIYQPLPGVRTRLCYCFARPTHAFHGLSSGLDFESKLFAA